MDEQCVKCSALCCRYYCFEIGKPDTFEEFENIRWYLLHEGTTVHIDLMGDWFIRIDNRCLMLEEEPDGRHRCKDYANRPMVCRRFSPKSCEFTRGLAQYEELFTTAAQLEEYSRRMLGDLAWQEGQARLQATREKRRKNEPEWI